MRPVKFTNDSVLDPFYQHKILTREEHQQLCGCSAMTAWRVLHEHGYLSSYNANAKYYTLIDIPDFDQRGLWSYKGIRFSRFGSLNQTMVEFVSRSGSGMTAREFEEVLGINNARTTLIKLYKEGKVSRAKVVGVFVYLNVELEPGEKQRKLRQTELEREVDRSELPGARKIIAVLVEWIVRPELRIDQVARRLARKGEKISRKDIRMIVEYYKLPQKKSLRLIEDSI
ncbi:MAG: hypothetical protein U9N73_10510 [Candidatus Auribacterota bacterium]|nr:hypothetical protein [Candidatus Auribacterota bacterium]